MKELQKIKLKLFTMDLFVQRISIKDRLKILKKKLGLNKNNFIFLVLANLIPYKNHQLVINAVELLQHKVKKNFKVIFLGSGSVEYKLFLNNLIKKKIENYFIFKNRTKKY